MPTFSSTPPLHTPRMLFSLLAMASPSFLADFSPSVENQSMWCCLRYVVLPPGSLPSPTLQVWLGYLFLCPMGLCKFSHDSMFLIWFCFPH